MLAVSVRLDPVRLIHALDRLGALLPSFDRAITKDDRGAGCVVRCSEQSGRLELGIDRLHAHFLLVPIRRVAEAARLQVAGFDKGVVGCPWCFNRHSRVLR